jgi:hypothetical protein
MGEKKVSCHRCHSLVSVDAVQYVPVGTDDYHIVCTACAEKSAGATITMERSSEGSGSVEQLICLRCRYPFNFDRSKGNVLRCPYCSRADHVQKYALDSQSLLDDDERVGC